VREPDFEARLTGETILVTGHTGFTGGWLCCWLRAIGCKVVGLGLAPITEPNLFDAAKVSEGLASHLADIRSVDAVAAVLEQHRPSLIFHLAAQPLVSRSYADPLESFSVNTMGTANVLEAARHAPSVRGVVCITTDKVYADQDWIWGYRETDRLGGKDPYSASKACAELVAACYRQTMAARGNGMGIAVARGGNIIGGGDWSMDRIIPDFYRALTAGAPLVLRNPDAVRPWQHVLALVHGYLILGAGLLAGDQVCNGEFNFGPAPGEIKSVRDLVEGLASAWARPDIEFGTASFIETRLLQVDSSKSRKLLGWDPPGDFQTTLAATAGWYRSFAADPGSARALTMAQIGTYRDKLRAAS